MVLVELEGLCLNTVTATLSMGTSSALCRMELSYPPCRPVLRVCREHGEKNIQMCFVILCVLSSVWGYFSHSLSYFWFLCDSLSQGRVLNFM